jgi:hypothetical protein
MLLLWNGREVHKMEGRYIKGLLGKAERKGALKSYRDK